MNTYKYHGVRPYISHHVKCKAWPRECLTPWVFLVVIYISNNCVLTPVLNRIKVKILRITIPYYLLRLFLVSKTLHTDLLALWFVKKTVHSISRKKESFLSIFLCSCLWYLSGYGLVSLESLRRPQVHVFSRDHTIHPDIRPRIRNAFQQSLPIQ